MRFLLLALLLASPLCFAKTVVVIQSYHLDYTWDADYIDAIRSVLGNDHEIHVFELDTKRLPKSQWPDKVASIEQSVSSIKPDIAILGDDNAFSLMASGLVEKQIPVVFLGVNGGPVQHPTLNHELVTGILERPFFAESIRHLQKVLRVDERFLVLMDDSPTMRNAVNDYFGEKRSAEVYGSQLDIVLTNDKETWLQSVFTAHEQYDAIIVGTHHTIRDAQETWIPPKELMAEATSRTQVPIFSFWDIFIGKGQSIGGFTISAHQEGITAARLASLVLNGVKPDRIPQLKSLSGHYVYSESGMKEWNLKLSPMIASQSTFVE
ncbi:ABC transporter substrate binding protein [Marinobacter sp. TBZ242]|uniref:ABC transporter substrate binding protein n=1 Tax=Marinobacter azerbaijanicus TaxID=3050455 RepID=A0ABT7IIE0_9GAMM|nr:ABC transporter substrate binding protein [Marinobacter sp. TBZ242]MDL0433482.1 ABC transporter substrate binding protein [Marinobacter sp. TBZ242]